MEKTPKENDRNDVLDNILYTMVKDGDHGLNVSDILVSYMNSRMLQDERDMIIDLLKKELDNYRQFDRFRITQDLELEYTFESNKIEGNTLTLRETDLVVNEGLTVSGKSMREHLEAINHQEAISYIKQLLKRNFSLA